MKAASFQCIAQALLLLAVACPAADVSVKPMIVSTKGRVTVTAPGQSPVPAAAQMPMEIKSEIRSAGKGYALISVVPGISARIKGDSAIRLGKAEVGADHRHAEIDLMEGKTLCTLSKQGSSEQKYRVIMGAREWAEALGTVWQSAASDARHSVAVLEGTVSWVSLPGIDNISVTAGSVLLADYELKDGAQVLVSVRVVNLLDGTITLYYLDGKPPTMSQATPEQLKEARDVFSDAVGDQFENLKTDERAALLSLLFDANRVLTSAGLAGIGATGGVGDTAVTSNNPADATSQITPTP